KAYNQLNNSVVWRLKQVELPKEVVTYDNNSAINVAKGRVASIKIAQMWGYLIYSWFLFECCSHYLSTNYEVLLDRLCYF
ncbi:MAG: hypothetical protein ABI220_01185, partial [Candidatus Saccharimonadales bacterium]